MRRLIEFIQANPALVDGASPPIRFLPQLLRYVRDEGSPLHPIRSAVIGAKPHESAVDFFQLRITWDEPRRRLTFAATPGATASPEPLVVDLSDSRLTMENEQPTTAEASPATPDDRSFVYEGETPPVASAA